MSDQLRGGPCDRVDGFVVFSFILYSTLGGVLVVIFTAVMGAAALSLWNHYGQGRIAVGVLLSCRRDDLANGLVLSGAWLLLFGFCCCSRVVVAACDKPVL